VESQLTNYSTQLKFEAQAPEEGEDFKLIADDYQQLIVPGM